MRNQYDKNNLKTGIWQTYHSNGVVESEGKYLRGKKVGTWKCYTSRRRLRSIGKMKNGLMEGTWKFYGQWKKEMYLQEVRRYKNGQLQGLWITYYDNGNVCEKIYYKNSNRTGLYTAFKSDKKKVWEGFELNNIRVGVWKHYIERGEHYSRIRPDGHVALHRAKKAMYEEILYIN